MTYFSLYKTSIGCIVTYFSLYKTSIGCTVTYFSLCSATSWLCRDLFYNITDHQSAIILSSILQMICAKKLLVLLVCLYIVTQLIPLYPATMFKGELLMFRADMLALLSILWLNGEKKGIQAFMVMRSWYHYADQSVQCIFWWPSNHSSK